MPEPSYAEVVDRLVAVTFERDRLRQTLRDLAEKEGDPALAPLVAIWQHKALAEAQRAETIGTRLALAERALRRLMAGKPAHTEIAAWKEAS